MPGGNGTGPWGMGPRSGRGFGYCNGNTTPGIMNPGMGMGFGRVGGMGYGRGRCQGNRWQFYSNPYNPIFPPVMVPPVQPYMPPTPAFSNEDYLKSLEAQKKYLEDNLENLKQEIEKKTQELEKK